MCSSGREATEALPREYNTVSLRVYWYCVFLSLSCMVTARLSFVISTNLMVLSIFDGNSEYTECIRHFLNGVMPTTSAGLLSDSITISGMGKQFAGSAAFSRLLCCPKVVGLHARRRTDGGRRGRHA